MIKVAMLSYWHVHAWDYTKQVLENPNTEITAVWDEQSERGQKAADKLGVPFIADLDELLARKDIDAVVVDSPTNTHRDIIVKAAKAGKHIFTEKVIAPTVLELNDIMSAVEEANVTFTISLPRLNDHYTSAIQDIINQGVLGQLTLVRSRLSHNGATAGWLPEHFFNLEQCGGGAFIDLGCHPMYLTRLFLGMPEHVTATYGYVTGKDVEDNAVAVLAGPNGSIGIVEAGFVNSHSPFSIEIHGTEGTLFYGFPDDRIMLRSNLTDEKKWVEVNRGIQKASSFEQWVDHLKNGTKALDNIQLAKDLTILMEASNRSFQEKRQISIEELL
jgi:1,5-anhydro-D-fructose reductase (1,5-anhydro-D-mannitol-forming)